MALSIKTGKSCEATTNFVAYLDRHHQRAQSFSTAARTKALHDARSAGVKVESNAASAAVPGPSEFERHLAGEAFNALRHDKTRDVVFLLDEDDVRVFRRSLAPSSRPAPMIRSVMTQGTEGQVAPPTMGAPSYIVAGDPTTATMSPVPLQVDEFQPPRAEKTSRTRRALPTAAATAEEQQPVRDPTTASEWVRTTEEWMPIRPQTRLGTATVPSTSAGSIGRAPSRSAHASPSRPAPNNDTVSGTTPSGADLRSSGVTGPTAAQSSVGTVAPLPADVWRAWVEHGAAPNPVLAAEHTMAAAAAHMHELQTRLQERRQGGRKRRRHHRPSCMYHKTALLCSGVIRTLSRACHSFPVDVLRLSRHRVLRARNGSALATDDFDFASGGEPTSSIPLPELVDGVTAMLGVGTDDESAAEYFLPSRAGTPSIGRQTPHSMRPATSMTSSMQQHRSPSAARGISSHRVTTRPPTSVSQRGVDNAARVARPHVPPRLELERYMAKVLPGGALPAPDLGEVQLTSGFVAQRAAEVKHAERAALRQARIEAHDGAKSDAAAFLTGVDMVGTTDGSRSGTPPVVYDDWTATFDTIDDLDERLFARPCDCTPRSSDDDEAESASSATAAGANDGGLLNPPSAQAEAALRRLRCERRELEAQRALQAHGSIRLREAGRATLLSSAAGRRALAAALVPPAEARALEWGRTRSRSSAVDGQPPSVAQLRPNTAATTNAAPPLSLPALDARLYTRGQSQTIEEDFRAIAAAESTQRAAARDCVRSTPLTSLWTNTRAGSALRVSESRQG